VTPEIVELTGVEAAAKDWRATLAISSESRRHLVAEIRKRLDAGTPIAQLAREAGVGRDTIYTWLGA